MTLLPNLPDDLPACPAGENEPRAAAAPQPPVDSASVSAAGAVRRTMATVWVFLGSQMGIAVVSSLLIGIVIGFLDGFSPLVHGAISSILWWLEKNLSILTTVLEVILAGMITAYFGASQLHVRLSEELSHTHFDRKWLFQGTAMLYTASFTLSLLISLFNAFASRFNMGIEENVLPDPYGFSAGFLFFLCVAVGGPILEECVFRGVLCRALSRWNKGFAIVFSALLFGLVHLNFYQAIPAFGMGLVLGYVYLRSGSLLVPIFMHIVNNSISMIAGYLPSDSPWAIVISLIILCLAIAGAVFIIQQKKEIGAMFRQCRAAVQEWQAVVHSGSFWLLPAFFLVAQFITAAATLILTWLIYRSGLF